MCALRFVEIFEEDAAGVINVVFGDEVAGDAVVTHPDTAAIYFTGSVETGRIIAEKAGRLLKKVSLELGGKNAIVVMV